MRRCEVCRLPRWLNGYTIGGAGIVLLIGLAAGGFSLSRSLQEWQYKSLLKQVAADGEIGPAEREELRSQATYLRVSAEQARGWETEVTGRIAQPPAAEKPRGPAGPGAPKGGIRRVREDLEQGRLGDAHRAATALTAERPQDKEVRRLWEEIERKVGVRIEVRLLGETGGHYTLEAPVALVAVKGESFRLYVKPNEAVYFYLYGVDRSRKVEVLFPGARANGGASNPLRAGREYWLPSPDSEGWRPLKGVKEVYTVASRWPARELERWEAELGVEDGEEAARRLLQALKERQAADVGGCDVRNVQFAGESGG